MSVAGHSWEFQSIAPRERSWRASIRKGTARWFPPALVFFLAAIGTFAIVLLREATPDLPSVSTLLHRTASPNELGLKVDSEGDRLVLSWNRQNPLMLSATRASLLIQDGAQRRTIHLDTGQLQDGSVAYKPVSNDVSFRLEVSGPEASGAASMRVLDGTSMTAAKPASAPGSPLHLAAKQAF